MKKIRVAQLAPLWKKVPPEKYGGTELIVGLLSSELAEMGVETYLLACGGSETKANLVEIIDRPLFDILGKFQFDSIPFADCIAIKKAFDLGREGKVDLIHNHMPGFHAAMLGSYSPVPVITTLHSSKKPDSPELAELSKGERFVSISDAQRELAPYLNYVDTVYHGIDVHSFEFEENPGDYLLFFATLWKEKGVDRAVEIARQSGKKLILSGDIRREEDFKEIEKYIDGDRIKYIGEVGFEEKNRLMKNAYAYLFPIRWSEAFGLTVVESLACGTSVIAYRNGSMPEVISDNRTGFLVNSIDEAVLAVGKIDQISRLECRKEAENRFDKSLMAKNYLKVYKKILGL